MDELRRRSKEIKLKGNRKHSAFVDFEFTFGVRSCLPHVDYMGHGDGGLLNPTTFK
jgi:hypothetical protein